jgi:hypothetical protein
MGNDNGESQGEQHLAHGHRDAFITRIAGPAGLGEEQRGQKFAGSAKTAAAPASKAPMSALPPTAQEAQQMSQAPAAPVSQTPPPPAQG